MLRIHYCVKNSLSQHEENSVFTEMEGEQSVPELALVPALETSKMRVESLVVAPKAAAAQAKGVVADPTDGSDDDNEDIEEDNTII